MTLESKRRVIVVKEAEARKDAACLLCVFEIEEAWHRHKTRILESAQVVVAQLDQLLGVGIRE